MNDPRRSLGAREHRKGKYGDGTTTRECYHAIDDHHHRPQHHDSHQTISSFARRLLYIIAAILVVTVIPAAVFRHAGNKAQDAIQKVTPSKHADVAKADRTASTQSMLAWLAPDEVAGQGNLPQARRADGGSKPKDGDTDVVFQPQYQQHQKPVTLIHCLRVPTTLKQWQASPHCSEISWWKARYATPTRQRMDYNSSDGGPGPDWLHH